MGAIACQFGQIVEITTVDETGGSEDTIELDLDGESRDDVLLASGFKMLGEWHTLRGVPQVYVESV